MISSMVMRATARPMRWIATRLSPVWSHRGQQLVPISDSGLLQADLVVFILFFFLMATYKTCANSAFKVLIGALTNNDNMIAEGIEEYGIIEEAAKLHLPEFVRDAVDSVEIKEPAETEADE